jgi:DNA repair and recombination protein RAD52
MYVGALGLVALLNKQCDVNEQGRCSVNVTAIVRITLKDGAHHEDVGCGQGENIKGRGAALDKVSWLP